jgi:pyruvate dehydrogenase E2 component (dihydrolipoamide acetyltransferase)
MPKLSLTMSEGAVIKWFKKEGEKIEKGEPVVEVIKWFKKEGEKIEKGEPVVEVLSDKVTYEVEAPASGIIRKIMAEEGDEVPVAETLAIITAPDEELPEVEAITEPAVERVEERIVASPAAKRVAKEHGVDLAQVKGTGPEGRIGEEDVRRFVEKTKGARKIREAIPFTGIRKTAAERVSLSAKTAPHSTITMEVDVTNARKLREKLQVSYTDVLVKAVAEALTEYSIINSTLEKDQIKVFEDVNVGVAVATEAGLIVPVIRNADKKSLEEVSSTLKELVEKARNGKLTKEEFSDGTFTITNLGMFGVDVFTPIINPPETAILGVGRIVEKPVVVDKKIVVKPVMQFSLSFDHRVVDGAPAAQFLQKVKEIIESSK